MILRLSFARVHEWGSTTVFDYSPEAGSSYRWFTPLTEGSAGTSSLPVEILGVQAATLDGRTVNALHNDQVQELELCDKENTGVSSRLMGRDG
ncbi:uncharacterized protein CPUR_08860 [Claviceps purpurea 20.1]|uniref:Uncharacterized protein n=1 Tax=Claviceps purpurea (strain 20.1) TaxID=1111077 RepID=M1W6X7_CLAP2|nr:uncharacterized protein CPUR_08860 [Claviceps purpurea 20.1]